MTVLRHDRGRCRSDQGSATLWMVFGTVIIFAVCGLVFDGGTLISSTRGAINDAEAAARIGAQVETGTVFMNRCDYLDPALAWTGVKDTGRGATLSSVGYETLTRPKSFHLRVAF